MRAFAVHGADLQLGLADVTADLVPALEELGFERAGAVFVRRFPADAPYAAEAAEYFETCAERIVLQAARREPIPWRAALETVLERAGPEGWWLVGSAALAARGIAVDPRDVDLVSDAPGCDRLAAVLSDVLVEPLVDGGVLGARWFRAFAGARVECVGGQSGPAPRLETIRWRGWELRVPPLELLLASRKGPA